MSDVRKFAMGAGIMLFVCMVAVRNSEPVKQYDAIRELKAQCELNLPRTDHCVIVAIPQSKD
jgi:hypothetical protein